MKEIQNAIREAVADFFGMLEHKARTGEMTDEDVYVVSCVVREAGGIHATVRDLATYYDQPETNIRHVINRNIMPKPQRRVYHDFGAFRKRVPSKWTKRRYKPTP